MRRLALGALLALAAAGVAAPACAHTYTFDDRVLDGVDALGLFSAPNTDLAGDAIKVVFTVDTSLGTRTTVPGVSDTVIGAMPTSPVSAMVTINGVTIPVDGNLVGLATTTAGQAIGFAAVKDILTEVNVVDATAMAPASLDDPFTPQGLSVGTFSFGTPSTDPNAIPVSEVVNFASAPEPATWGLVLLGVAMAGGAVRHRQRRPLAGTT